jgi:hypothetical protein
MWQIRLSWRVVYEYSILDYPIKIPLTVADWTYASRIGWTTLHLSL